MKKRFKFFKRTNRRDEHYGDRVLFILDAVIGGTIFSLTTGAFMAGFAVFLGASDSFSGLIAVIPMTAGIIQIFSAILLERFKNKKPVIVIFSAIYKIAICITVLIPLLIHDTKLRLFLLFLIVTLSYCCMNIVFPGFTSWLVSTVSPRRSGRYFGIKDSYALAFITIMSLAMGWVLDYYKSPGDPNPQYTGFFIVFMTSLALSLINIAVLMKIKAPKPEETADAVSLHDCFLKPLRNKSYMKVVVFYILWNIGLNLGAPFMPLYQVKYLQMDYKYIMLLSVAANISMALAVRVWGRLADKKNWIDVGIYSIAVLSFTHFLWGFVTKSTMYMLPAAFILGGIAWGGINISLFNIPFMFIPKEGKTIYLGFNAAIAGVFGLSANLLAGTLISVVEGKSINLCLVSLSGIQLVIIVSAAFFAACSLYGYSVLLKLYNSRAEFSSEPSSIDPSLKEYAGKGSLQE